MTQKKLSFKPLTDTQIARYCGCLFDPGAIAEYCSAHAHPVFEFCAGHLAGSASDAGVVCLWKFAEQLEGKPFEYGRQTIGDCTSWGAMHCLMCLSATQIVRDGRPERWGGPIATEPIYAFGRVEIGGGRIRGDGCIGPWIADALKRYGVLLRTSYGAGDLDLSRYSGQKAKKWGRPGAGVPDELEPVSREHLLQTASLVTTFDQAADAIANGYPVMVCSNQGFADRTDSEGFAEPHGQWAHAMAFLGVDVTHHRKGLLCKNSWGPHWIEQRGTRHEQPPGSFWVDARVVDRMLGERSSFAYSGFHGFPKRDLLDFGPLVN